MTKKKEFDLLKGYFLDTFSAKDEWEYLMDNYTGPKDLLDTLQSGIYEIATKYGVLRPKWRAELFNMVRIAHPGDDWPLNPFHSEPTLTLYRAQIQDLQIQPQVIGVIEGPDKCNPTVAVLSHAWEKAIPMVMGQHHVEWTVLTHNYQVIKVNGEEPRLPFANQGVHPWAEAILEHLNRHLDCRKFVLDIKLKESV